MVKSYPGFRNFSANFYDKILAEEGWLMDEGQVKLSIYPFAHFKFIMFVLTCREKEKYRWLICIESFEKKPPQMRNVVRGGPWSMVLVEGAPYWDWLTPWNAKEATENSTGYHLLSTVILPTYNHASISIWNSEKSNGEYVFSLKWLRKEMWKLPGGKREERLFLLHQTVSGLFYSFWVKDNLFLTSLYFLINSKETSFFSQKKLSTYIFKKAYTVY